MKRILSLFLLLGLVMFVVNDAVAQPPGFNYEEAKVPEYTLPDPLVMSDGTPVTTAEQWRTKRRPELLNLIAAQQFGKLPGKALPTKYEVVDDTPNALSGKAHRKQIVVTFGEAPNTLQMEILLYMPPRPRDCVPLFMGLNFGGNQTIHADPGIRITKSWVPGNGKEGVVDNKATEKTRGTAASRWQVEKILDNGFALATIYCGDIDPDFDDGFQNGIHPFFYNAGEMKPGVDEWGSIGAWAWGLSRGLDYMQNEERIDTKRVAVMGHSRLGKTALWAGATDERFAIVISNNSGEGGAAITRRKFGETIARINTSFPHWFCDNFVQYNDKENDLPFDAHELLAMCAPRPVYVASAAEDLWADPRGEFLACLHASPVYRLLGTIGLPATEMPELEKPVHGTIGYHIRAGKHDVTAYDWNQYIQFAKKHWNK